jgi:hypothetical protein
MGGGHLIWHRSVGSILARGGIFGSRRHFGLRGGILWLAVTLMQRVLIQKGDPFRSWRILVLLLWFAKKSQTIQYSRTEFRKKKRDLNVPLVGYPAPSFSRIVGPRRMIQTNKFCFPEKELPGERQSISQAPFVLPFRSSFLANSFHFLAISNASLLQLTRKRDFSEENGHAAATNRWRVRQLPISQESASVVGQRHVKKKERASGGEKTKPVTTRLAAVKLRW